MKKLIVALAALLSLALPLISTGNGRLSEAEEHHRKAAEYLDESQLDEAIAEFTKAIDLDPNLAEAYAGRALAYTALDRDQEAERDIDKAVELGLDADVLNQLIEGLKALR